MEVRQIMRRFLPAARSRTATSEVVPRSSETKVVLADYYASLASVGLYNAYRSRPWPVERAVAEGYERVVWVYKGVEAIAGNAARLPFRLKQGEEALEDHPLYRVLNKRANPLETGQQFRKRLSTQILLSKRGAFVEITKSRGGDIIRLDLLPPGRTRPVPGEGLELVSEYEVIRADGTKRRIPKENVRWFREPHPLDPFSGVTPLEAAGMSIELDFFTRLYNISFLKNDTRPGGVLSINGDMGPEEMDRIEQKFEKGPSESGKLTVIAGEVSYADFGQQPRDMHYEVMSQTSKREILTALGVPESVIGDASGRTWDNAEQEEHNFWKITMPPHLALMASGFDDDSDDDLEGFFDTELVEVLQRSARSRREEARIEFEAGLISIDEYREIAGYELVDNEHTRALYIAQAKTPIPTSEEDAKKFGLVEEEAAEQEVAVAEAVAAASPAPVAKPAAKPADEDAEGGDSDPKAPPAPAKPAKKRLAVLLGNGEASPVYVRPTIRLVRSTEAKALSRQAESNPEERERDKLEDALAATLTALSVRLTARAATRLSSPKARKGTRHWAPESSSDLRVGTKAVDVTAAVDSERWREEVERAVRPLIEAMAETSGAALLDDIDDGPPAADMAAVVAPIVALVVASLGEAAYEKALELIEMIRAADEAGAVMADLAVTVRGFANRMTKWAKGSSISAATATINGSRDATAQAWLNEAPGRDIIRTWRHRGDARVRATHREAGGQKRPLGEPFEVGEAQLDFPGDPEGPLEEIAGCRCWLNHRSTVTGRFVSPPLGGVARMLLADRTLLDAALAPPTITEVSPAVGGVAGGTRFTVTGTNFIPGATVAVGGIAATAITVVDATTITATSPALAVGTYEITVTTASGTTTAEDPFTVARESIAS